MSTSNKSKLRRVMCGLLSTLTMLSGTAVAGTATAYAAEAPAETSSASSSGDASTFSWDNASVYFLLTDRFYNGDTSNDHAYGRGLTQSGSAANYDNYAAFQGGDFKGVTKKINEGYFDDLGVNAIWLSAPYEQIHGYCVGTDGDSFAHYSYHGYYVLDYTESDKNFGTKEEFKELVDTAHEHGIRIVMDIVMNHAGYNTIQDMSEYSFGELKSGWENYYYSHSNINNTSYHGYINYDASSSVWGKWWGSDWIRCGLPGYTSGSGDIEGSLAGLPDFKTGVTSSVGLPELLKTKWQKEGTYSAKAAKYGSDTVTGHISTWLAEWVRDYGVDGFRCDTAKHVELSAWNQLKTKCVEALREWKQNNPTKKLDDLDFWMTGECFGHKAEKSQYYTQGGFDSMINFEFAPGVNQSNIPSAGSVDSVYSRYANSINNDPSFNVLTYLASHDTTLISGDRKYAGSFLLMCPGGIQIYYGDETNRPLVNSRFASVDPGAGHQFRSFMNWDSLDQSTLSHWDKVGTFRNNHIAVGAGSHQVISSYDSSNGYTFSRTYNKNGIQDTIVATLFAQANKDITIDVSSVWSDGIEITNWYDGTTCRVSGGKVTFNSGANGTILMQEPQGSKGKVTVTHINQDSGETIKTETLSGLIGDAYTANPLDTEGFTVSRTVGSTTGTFSETEGSVSFYYTFDSSNFGYVTVKHVDSSNAEIADSDTKVGRIGTSYTTEPKSIKNYELDTTPTNASGSFKSGTTTVTYKYKYVEPSNLQVHYYNSNNWSTVNLYAYSGDGDTATKYVGEWPGKAMTAEGNGWFYADVSDTEAALVMFNNGSGSQEPGSMQPGYSASGEVWIKSATVYPTGKVNVKYVSTTGTTLGSEIIKGMADGTNTYSTTAKTFTGYTLSSTPSNATGKFTESAINVTYTYSPNEVQPTDLVNNSKANASTITLGDTVTLTGAASGGTAPYTYSYYFKQASQSAWSTKAENTTSTSVSIKPGSAVTYNFKVVVKDSGNQTKEKTFNVTVNNPVSALVNNSKVASTSINLGSTINITGAASGGTAPYTYSYYYKQASQSAWSTKLANTTTTSTTVKPGSAVDYNVKVVVKDSAGQTKEKSFTITVKSVSALVNNSKVASTSINLGSTINITGAASGGTAPYTYSYYYKQASQSSWSTKLANTTATSTTVKPGSAVSYNVRVVVKDSSGNTAEKMFTVSVIGESDLVNNSKVNASSILLGESITATGVASKGTAPYKYAFYYKRSTASSWTLKGTEYGTATTMSFVPQAAVSYDVMINIKDSTGTMRSCVFTVSVKESTLTNKSTVKASTVVLGNPIEVTGAASGGTAPYKYSFYYKRTTETSWKNKGGVYGTATSMSFIPQADVVYNVKVDVKDSKGTVKSKTMNVTVKKSTLANNSSIASSTITLGNSVTMKAAATGGTAPYTYTYFFKQATNTTWTIKDTANTTATTMSFKPSQAVNYDVRINVKDSLGTVVSKTFRVTVNPASTTALTNNSKVASTTITLGNTINITGAASGGTAPYKYTYYFKQSTSTGWTLKGTADTTSTSVTVKPSVATVYNIKIVVKDNTGKTAEKTFSVTVNQATTASLTNKSTISSASINLGDTITMNAAASGGTAPYKYSYYFKQSTATSWTVKGTELSTQTSQTLKPSAAKNYDIMIKVTDNTGETVEKRFTVTVK